MWFKRRKKRRQGRKTRALHHYTEHKELARIMIHERIEYWNAHYAFTYNRIAIKNQRRCWGSCSLKKNLNFNYRIIFLPETLMDYVIVHELCHLVELNHGKFFWDHVARTMPGYREYRRVLRKMNGVPPDGFPSSAYQKHLATASLV